MSTSWVDAEREILFARVAGGFIFKGPGLFPHHYLVTEAQKAEIQRLMRTPAWPSLKFIFIFILAWIGFCLLAVALQLLWEWASGTDQSGAWTLIAPLLFFPCCIIVRPERLLAVTARSGQIGQILAGAHQTEQRITLQDRNRTYARLVPLSKLLAVGVGCALISALFAILAFRVPLGSLHFYPQQQLVAWFNLVPLALFALFAVRFFYIAVLKLSLERTA